MQTCMHKCVCASLPQTCPVNCSSSLSYWSVPNRAGDCSVSCHGHRAAEQRSSEVFYPWFLPFHPRETAAPSQPQVCMCLHSHTHVLCASTMSRTCCHTHKQNIKDSWKLTASTSICTDASDPRIHTCILTTSPGVYYPGPSH